MTLTTFHTANISNQKIFYREAGQKDDPFFLPPGADAFQRDIPDAEVRFFDAGHFALETHHAEIATVIRDFLARTGTSVQHIAV